MLLQECKLKPYGGAIYGDAADYIAEQLVCAGYRKQSDVVKQIIEILKAAKSFVKVHFEAYDELIENIATEYGAQVEQQ